MSKGQAFVLVVVNGPCDNVVKPPRVVHGCDNWVENRCVVIERDGGLLMPLSVRWMDGLKNEYKMDGRVKE